MSRLFLFPALILVVACKPPPEAPAELGDLSIFLFENFAAEDVEVLDVGTLALEAFLVDLDMEARVQDRSFTLPILTEEHFGGIDGSPAPTEEQIPVGVAGESRHDLDASIALVEETNHVCIESNTTKYYSREFLSELDCFMNGECETVATVNEVLKENALATIWYDMYKDYRVIELEDGRRAMISRSWIAEVFEAEGGGNNSWDQSYAIDVWLPRADDASKTLRYLAVWSSVHLGGIGDDAWSTLVRDGIDESFENSDNFIDGEMCGTDRDREYDRGE